jgi:hypothetical protein
MANFLPFLLAAGAAALILGKKKGSSSGALVETDVLLKGAMRGSVGVVAEWQVVGLAPAPAAGFAPGEDTAFGAQIKLARDNSFTMISTHPTAPEAEDAAQTALIAKGFTDPV